MSDGFRDDPPSLQQLVVDYGTWDKIPHEAWQAFDTAMAKWKDKSRYGELRDVVDRSKTIPRRALLKR